MSKYMKINYDKLISILEDLSYPYSDTLINIFYNFSNNSPTEFSFDYIYNNEQCKTVLQSVLSFSRSCVENIFDINEELEEIIEDDFFPFALDEYGNYIGLYINEIGEELVYLCLHDDLTFCPIVDENGDSLSLDDFSSKM